jgi:inner membrane protein
VDSFTHAFAISLLLLAAGYALFIPFAVLGAVILDIDFLFAFLSKGDPSLYIFTHGGFTHSLLGAAFVSLVAFGALKLLSATSFFQERIGAEVTYLAFIFILLGAVSHIFLDFLAAPGIPLLYPLTDEKFTAAIFPGPSIVLFAVSIIFLILLLLRKTTLEQMGTWAAIFLLVIAVSAGLKVFVALNTEGTTIPTLNPLAWLVISENESAYTVSNYSLLHGTTGSLTFEKFTNLTPAEAQPYTERPEYRRFAYYSYLTTAERNATHVTFRDPLREQKILFYPPSYQNVSFEAV